MGPDKELTPRETQLLRVNHRITQPMLDHWNSLPKSDQLRLHRMADRQVRHEIFSRHPTRTFTGPGSVTAQAIQYACREAGIPGVTNPNDSASRQRYQDRLNQIRQQYHARKTHPGRKTPDTEA